MTLHIFISTIHIFKTHNNNKLWQNYDKNEICSLTHQSSNTFTRHKIYLYKLEFKQFNWNNNLLLKAIKENKVNSLFNFSELFHIIYFIETILILFKVNLMCKHMYKNASELLYSWEYINKKYLCWHNVL